MSKKTILKFEDEELKQRLFEIPKLIKALKLEDLDVITELNKLHERLESWEIENVLDINLDKTLTNEKNRQTELKNRRKLDTNIVSLDEKVAELTTKHKKIVVEAEYLDDEQKNLRSLCYFESFHGFKNEF